MRSRSVGFGACACACIGVCVYGFEVYVRVKDTVAIVCV